MVRFNGYDKNGNVIFTECKTHLYEELPGKGLGKSFEDVGLEEPVIIDDYKAGLNPIQWGYSKAEIERRAYELNAEICWMEMPFENGSPKTKIWFKVKQ